jgi:dihydroorotase
MLEAVKAGYVDAIATDHAPHTAQEKAAGVSGFTGLDLSFATCHTTLVRGGHISLTALSRLMSYSPARLMGIPGGLIEEGEAANLVLLELERPFTASGGDIHSKSKNSPLLGHILYGRVMMTIKEGEILYENAD